MHIIHIASELTPIAKVGGLADVIPGLSSQLVQEGHQVEIVIPKYDTIKVEELQDFKVFQEDCPSFFEEKQYSNTIWSGSLENQLKIYLVDAHHPRHFFKRGMIYSCEDDIDRFLYFSKAALEFVAQVQPDILHLHDWQTASIAPLLSEKLRPKGLKSKIVYTIHNFEYQGKCSGHDLDKVGLDSKFYLTPDRLQDSISPKNANLMKGGIIYADYVTTVSPSYAKEVLTPVEGKGLQETLKKYRHKFEGVLNGIDINYWDPENDRYLSLPFSSRDSSFEEEDHAPLQNKEIQKMNLRHQLHLEEVHRPLIAGINRLVPQKGVELIKHAVLSLPNKRAQFVLLASGPIKEINEEFHQLQQKALHHPHLSIILAQDEKLAHQIYAAADIFIVPSIFEPCGLTQMIALRYGAIPVVRKTGGLRDTVFDRDDASVPLEKKNGFVFVNANTKEFDQAIDRAIHLWFENPKIWRKMVIKGMQQDFSWSRSSHLYLEIYKKISEN